jgi:hypothetical protein
MSDELARAVSEALREGERAGLLRAAERQYRCPVCLEAIEPSGHVLVERPFYSCIVTREELARAVSEALREGERAGLLRAADLAQHYGEGCSCDTCAAMQFLSGKLRALAAELPAEEPR